MNTLKAISLIIVVALPFYSNAQFFKDVGKAFEQAAKTVESTFTPQQTQPTQNQARCATNYYNAGPTDEEIYYEVKTIYDKANNPEVICSYKNSQFQELETRFYVNTKLPSSYIYQVEYPSTKSNPTIGDYARDRAIRLKMNNFGCFLPQPVLINAAVKTSLTGYWLFNYRNKQYKINVSSHKDGLIAELIDHIYKGKPSLVAVKSFDKTGASFYYTLPAEPNNHVCIILSKHEMGGVTGAYYESTTGKTVELGILKPGGGQLEKSVFNPNALDNEGHTKFTKAAHYNNEVSFNEGIEYGTNINAMNKAGDAPIHIATKYGHTSMIAKLLSNKADINILDAKGRTALYHAISTGNMATVNTLLSNGANGNIGGALGLVIKNNNKSALSALAAYNTDLTAGFAEAARQNNTEMFKAIGSHGGKSTDIKTFMTAVGNQNQEIARICLENGTNATEAMNYIISKKQFDYIGMCLENGSDPVPAIGYAVDNRNTALCISLMDTYKVNPNAITNYALYQSINATGQLLTTPKIAIAKLGFDRGANSNLHIISAVKANNTLLVETLLKAGANANEVLSNAVQNSNNGMAQLSFNYGAKATNPELIAQSVKRNEIDLTTLLLANGAVGTAPFNMDVAVENGSVQMVSLLIQNGANANVPKLLFRATEKKQIAMCDLLIKSGASCTDPSIIRKAVELKLMDITKLYILNGAPLNDEKLILQAVINVHLEMVQLLIANGTTFTDKTIMQKAVSSKNTDIVSLLINNNGKTSDETLIQTAVDNKQIEMVKILVEHGASATPGIDKAIAKNHSEISLYLLNKGADASNPQLMSTAAGFGNYEVVTKLIQFGAKPDDGLVPAIKNKHPKVLSFLISQQANIKTEENMYLAVSSFNEEIYQIVLNAGAPTTWKGKNGGTLIHFLKSTNVPNVIPSLAQNGVNVNHKDNNGNTALLLAAQIKNNTTAVSELIKAGADLNATDSDGKSVLKNAKGRDVKNLLKDAGAEK